MIEDLLNQDLNKRKELLKKMKSLLEKLLKEKTIRKLKKSNRIKKIRKMKLKPLKLKLKLRLKLLKLKLKLTQQKILNQLQLLQLCYKRALIQFAAQLVGLQILHVDL